MYDGFDEGAATFRFRDFKTCRKQEKPLVRPYDRDESSIEQLANGEVNEEDRLLMPDELFKKGFLDAKQTLDVLREHEL